MRLFAIEFLRYHSSYVASPNKIIFYEFCMVNQIVYIYPAVSCITKHLNVFSVQYDVKSVPEYSLYVIELE